MSTSVSRKTILDIGDTFRNNTYDHVTDITIATRDSSCKNDRVAPKGHVFFLPGIDMSGLSCVSDGITVSERRNVSVVLAGYGTTLSLDSLSQYVADHIRKNNMTDVVLIGESFGGVLALDVSSRLPGIVSKMVLINPATCFPRTNWLEFISTLNRSTYHILVQFILSNGPGVKNVSKTFRLLKDKNPKFAYQYLLSITLMAFNVLVTDPRDVVDRIKSYLHMKESEMEELYREVDIETVVIVGGDDTFFPSYEEAKIIQRHIPNTLVVNIDEAGHLITPDLLKIHKYVN